MPKKSKPEEKKSASILLGIHLRSHSLGKNRYAQSDAAMAELLKEVKPGEIVKTPSGKKYRLVDKHDSPKKVVCIAICRRYEFEEVTEP